MVGFNYGFFLLDLENVIMHNVAIFWLLKHFVSIPNDEFLLLDCRLV